MAASCLHNQLSSIHSITRIKRYRCLKKVIHQLDNKNEWLLLLASFKVKLRLIFVVTLENTFSYRFYFKVNKKSIDSSKNGTRDFQNSPPIERSTCLYVTISRNFERFQYFNLERDFLENEHIFQKTETLFFS